MAVNSLLALGQHWLGTWECCPEGSRLQLPPGLEGQEEEGEVSPQALSVVEGRHSCRGDWELKAWQRSESQGAALHL